MTINQILAFLENNKLVSGCKADLERVNTKSVSVPVASIKALVVDDGFRYDDEEIEMNPTFLNDETVIAGYGVKSKQFIGH